MRVLRGPGGRVFRNITESVARVGGIAVYLCVQNLRLGMAPLSRVTSQPFVAEPTEVSQLGPFSSTWPI